jgi:polyisoprenoid-binding protein YceI
LSVTITLHGTSRTMRVPVQIDVGADEVRVDGGLSLRQTDFGIKPLSVLGGAVQVQDLVDLRFRIRALRILQVAAGLPAARASSEPR